MLTGKHINKLIAENIPVFKGHISPIFTTDVDSDSVIYFIKPVDSEVISQIQLEIRVICSDYDDLEAYTEQITNLFTTNENKSSIVVDDVSFRGGLSGGGTLFRDDLQLYENTMFFSLKVKNEGGIKQ
ncbi:hypothetical protein LISE100100_00345 [Listeria seeligeri]|uniref:hypothetical protein n=1 Tax=Listeria seeligeri TaxID=1640 RepID=UPI0001C4EC4F|nr:hypothetical protein [Listeria seeligeri]CBH27755.1 hypothetical protein lse_1604 [Listeria seeligeri serovar 1/2b str. SLCC3954]